MIGLHLSMGGDAAARAELRLVDEVTRMLPAMAASGADPCDMEAAACGMLNPLYDRRSCRAAWDDEANDN